MPRRRTSTTFTTGQNVSLSGIYRTTHPPHPVRSQVPLLVGLLFPGCSKCLAPVRFGLLRGVRVECAQSPYRLLGELH